jgi:hypothetical protein
VVHQWEQVREAQHHREVVPQEEPLVGKCLAAKLIRQLTAMQQQQATMEGRANQLLKIKLIATLTMADMEVNLKDQTTSKLTVRSLQNSNSLFLSICLVIIATITLLFI